MRKLLLLLLIAIACASSPPSKPNEREWGRLMADYQWIQTLRGSQRVPAADASRKHHIAARLENHRKLEPPYVAFIDKLHEYHRRTGDPRAAVILAREKIVIGDEYMNVLARYDRALDLFREALRIDPSNPDAAQRIAAAEKKRFVSMEAFVAVKQGMREEEVRRLVGMPREDWIKQVVQNNRVYSVWIYPKGDGGASAVYFDNGVVYHTNWNAAAPSQPQASK